MKAVTGKHDVIDLAEKIGKLCREHTSRSTVARAALQIAEICIATDDSQSFEERLLCAKAPKRLLAAR